MLRILLLDCSESLENRLKAQGFDVGLGTIGFCTGKRRLPCQVYENDIIIYSPDQLRQQIVQLPPENATPQFSLQHLEATINRGSTVLIFANRLSNDVRLQNAAYNWIPFMPTLESTHDSVILLNSFEQYPDHSWKSLAPVVTKAGLRMPVRLKLRPPPPKDYPKDVFWLFGNNNSECLGVLIERGQGRLIVLPQFESSDSVTETFLHRVAPKIYNLQTPVGLIEMFTSPAESSSRTQLCNLELTRNEMEKRIGDARVQLETARRNKRQAISTDPTAKQLLIYYTEALRQPDTALFYLYKIVESIENRFGGETAGITAIGSGNEWKAVKRLANETYRDARHAPKPTDVIKKWTNDEIKKCFLDVQKIVMAYFATLF